MRLDHFITLNLVYPLKQNIKKNREFKIPILMYHSISDEPENGHPYFWINTSPQRFTEQMQFLHDNNYKVISIEEAVNILTGNSQPETCSHVKHATRNPQLGTDNYVVLTFDDGYRNVFTNALPILRKYGFCATLYLPTNLIGTKSLKGEDRLCWDEPRELRNSGIAIGSHTVNHLQLKVLKREEIEYEIRSSKEKIEENLGETIYSFSYPYAFPESDKELKIYLRAILEASGYKNGVTTIIGMAGEADSPFFLKRLPVNSRDDLFFFKTKLAGCYDWMHVFQYAKKIMMAKF